jgi:hypothetical protein
MPDMLESRFHDAMVNIYRESLAINYRPRYFLGMVIELGGVNAAKRLINNPDVSEGFLTLLRKGRLDLSVEALAVDNSEYHVLFSSDELVRAKTRLLAVGYRPRENK